MSMRNFPPEVQMPRFNIGHQICIVKTLNGIPGIISGIAYTISFPAHYIVPIIKQWSEFDGMTLKEIQNHALYYIVLQRSIRPAPIINLPKQNVLLVTELDIMDYEDYWEKARFIEWSENV